MTPTPSSARGRTAPERGSIPLALLVIITLSGVIGALVVTTIGSGNAARFDQNYTEVIQVADTGAVAGATYMTRVITAENKRNATIGTKFTGSGAVDGVPYEWEAEKVSALGWDVRGTSTQRDVERAAVIRVADRPRFFVAAFSDRGFEMRGGNGADSYGASAWSTGNGIVASNESITIRGSTRVDAVHLYNWDNNANLNRCTHNGNPNQCEGVTTLPEAILPSARIGPRLVVGSSQLETAFITEELDACEAGPPIAPLENYTASTYGGANLSNSQTATLGTAGDTTVLCFDNVTINRNLNILGTVEIYVRGDLLFGTPPVNDVQVNCGGGCTVGNTALDSRTLSFFVEGSGDPSDPSLVGFGNHSAIVGGIYAPESACEGNPSNAQVDVYGSLICQTISNQGGWKFHYDDRLHDVGVGDYQAREWREENP